MGASAPFLLQKIKGRHKAWYGKEITIHNIEETHMSKCSKNIAVSKTLAAMATTLTIGSMAPVANANGLTGPQVRAIVRQEVAKIPRIVGPKGPTGATGAAGPTGPAGGIGPQGPAGMDGVPTLFAHVFGTGVVDDRVPGGIAQENVQRVDMNVKDNKGRPLLDTTYCFSGLPPVSGGQVTIDGNGRSNELGSANIDMATQDPECPIRVAIAGRNAFFRGASNFFILLY